MRLFRCLLAAVLFAGCPRVAAAYDESSPAVVANKDLHLAFAPVLLVPLDDRPLGGGLDLEVRYGIGADPVIVAPGGRISGFVTSGHIVFMGTPTVRVTAPVGPVAPFLTGGLGLGAITNSTDEGADSVRAWGLAVLAGGGVMVHVSRLVGLGVEVTYRTITSSDLEAVMLAPAFSIGF